MSWPAIMDPTDITERYVKAQVRSSFEKGYVQSRAKYTIGKMVFSPSWKAMPESDFSTLIAFFEANQGSTFSWDHPVSGTTYTVRFATDQINSRPQNINMRSVDLELEQVLPVS